MAVDLIGRLFTFGRDRDGRAEALSSLAERPAADPLSARPTLPDPQHCVHEAIATKLLHGWLANRHQTLVPHTLNFRALAPAQAALLIAVMAAAAQADGLIDPSEARQAPAALDRVGAGEAEARQLTAAMQEPQPLARIVAEVQQAGLGAHAYAAALLTINRSNRVNRLFLDYLAARLALPAEVAGSLERRYRA